MCVILAAILELEVIQMDLTPPVSSLAMITVYPGTHFLLHIFLSAVPGIDLSDYGVFTRMSAVSWSFFTRMWSLGNGVATGLATAIRNCCDEYLEPETASGS